MLSKFSGTPVWKAAVVFKLLWLNFILCAQARETWTKSGCSSLQWYPVPSAPAVLSDPTWGRTCCGGAVAWSCQESMTSMFNWKDDKVTATGGWITGELRQISGTVNPQRVRLITGFLAPFSVWGLHKTVILSLNPARSFISRSGNVYLRWWNISLLLKCIVLQVCSYLSGRIWWKSLFTLCIFRLQELTVCSEDNADVHDIELLQYISVDCSKLKRLLQGMIWACVLKCFCLNLVSQRWHSAIDISGFYCSVLLQRVMYLKIVKYY